MAVNINYKNFFEACRKKLIFETTEKGSINVYDLFDLPIEDLKKIYAKLKGEIIVEDDPILADIIVEDEDTKRKKLQFEIVRDIILWKLERAKKNELLEKKKQLEKMLAEVKLRKLQENPEELMKELEEINQQLNEQ